MRLHQRVLKPVNNYVVLWLAGTLLVEVLEGGRDLVRNSFWLDVREFDVIDICLKPVLTTFHMDAEN